MLMRHFVDNSWIALDSQKFIPSLSMFAHKAFIYLSTAKYNSHLHDNNK